MAPRKNDTPSVTPRVAGETVVGLFADQSTAERGIQALKAAGFSEQQIGVAVRDRAQQQAITEGTGTQTAEGAAAGAVGGGMVGGVIGLLAGVGALVIPGIGPIIAAGALASTLTGAGIGAAAGGLIGALAGMGIPDEDAKHFDRGFQEGGVLVTVQADGDPALARQALLDSEADLGPAHAAMRTSAAPATRSADRLAGAIGDDQENRIPLMEEDVRVPTTSGSEEAWRGNERRYREDAGYSGPERRLATR
jgi:hypothetical protein